MHNWKLKVTVLNQGQPAFSELFERSPITIGGLPHNDIVLSDGLVSGEHAWVTVSRGKATYHDRSRNGSFVGQTRIETRDLEPDEMVQVPPFELRFELLFTDEERRTTLRDTAQMIQPEIPGPEKDTPSGPRPAPPRSGPPTLEPLYLRVTEGPPEVQGRSLTVEGLKACIGRGEDASLRFDLPTLSRVHAEFSRTPEGWRVEDLGSSNGTYVNNQRVEGTSLKLGDTVTFGRDLVVVVSDEAPRQQDEAPANGPSRSPSVREATDVPVLEIRERRAPGEPAILVLEVRGRVDGYNYTELAEELARAIDASERLLIVDFTELAFIDHTGLGALVNAASRLDRLKGHLRLVGIGPQLRDTFELSRLDTLFRGRLAEDEAAAVRELASYGRDRT